MRTIFRVFAWLKRYPLLAWGQFSCAIAGVIMVLGYPIAIRRVMDTALPQKDLGALGFWVGMALLTYLAKDLFEGLRIFLNNTFEQRVIFDLRSDLYARLQRLPLPWFDSKPTGDIMTTVAEDVTSVERVLIDGIEQGLVASLQILVVGGFLFFLNPWLAAIALIPFPILMVGALWYTTTSRPRHREVRKMTSAMNSLLMDNISGIRQIKAYTREEPEHQRFNAASQGVQTATLRVMKAWAFYKPSMAFAGSLGIILVVYFGGRAVIRENVVSLDGAPFTAASLTAFLFTMIGFFYEPISRLHQLNQILQSGRAAAERVFGILDEPMEPDESRDLSEVAASEPQAPIKGHVEYRQVSFAYNERLATLTRVSLEAKPGETIALVGPTGAGKSTIINLLCRFYELPAEGCGEILLDGQPIQLRSKRSLREAIGYVTQESFLFNGTVKENLMLAKAGATEDELWLALSAANADHFIKRLPQQLDTEVGERGVRLSVGEKQRISIARALLKNPPILLLDEATASVDTETERQIQEALDRLMVGRTSFVIAHRLSTVRHADRIYVLQQGQIAEVGTHDSLLAQGGLYAELCQHSFLSSTSV